MAADFRAPGERMRGDVLRVARAISRHFETDSVVIVGSQSVLVDQPDAPLIARMSGEIDAYPGNIREWEERHLGALASEEINAWFGTGSQFHETFGFYIDGVDEKTAKLPPEWEDRAIEKTIDDDGRAVRLITPCLEDLIVSKLHRLSDKDRDFIRAFNDQKRLDVALIRRRLSVTDPHPAITIAADRFLETL